MKKLLSILLVFAMLTCFSACGNEAKEVSATVEGKTEIAFTNSKEAFSDINYAYQKIDKYSEDIYEAWRLGVNYTKSYGNVEFDTFAREMNIERVHIEAAVAKLSGKNTFDKSDWTYLPYLYNKSAFSACVATISEAYICSGDVDEISNLLINAKTIMKDLSATYSDYEHYPALKSYFTNTLAFFDFCVNPEGSFEQVVETFNNYRNNAREGFFALNYIFEDSIDGMRDIREV